MQRHTPFLIGLILPLLAVYELTARINVLLILGYIVVISALSFGLTWHDKRRAGRGGWRVPEKTLHLCELLGGWPAAYLAQQIYRHKTGKRPYRIVFWCIIGLHQFLALEWITGWRISRWVLSLL